MLLAMPLDKVQPQAVPAGVLISQVRMGKQLEGSESMAPASVALRIHCSLEGGKGDGPHSSPNFVLIVQFNVLGTN